MVLISFLCRSLTALTGGTVRDRRIEIFTSEASATRVELAVQHNGSPLSPEDLRDGVSLTDPAYGHLAIFICRTVVEECGGILHVETGHHVPGVQYRMIFPV